MKDQMKDIKSPLKLHRFAEVGERGFLFNAHRFAGGLNNDDRWQRILMQALQPEIYGWHFNPTQN